MGMPAYKIQKRPRKTNIKPASHGIYSPLDSKRHEFRILVLRPGSYEKPLRGSLKTIRFPEGGKKEGSALFETVSYVWGDKSIRDKITINGQVLDIPASAASALRCLRFRHGERLLWIDSICINQANVHERAQQVSMMAKIYPCAHTNLIHLGEDDEQAESAFDSIERIVREIDESVGGIRLKEYIFYGDMRFKRSTDPLNCEPNWDALAWLFNRPWFSRLWVVQEQLLSNRSIAYCGKVSGSMDRVLTVAGWLQHKLLHIPDSLSSEGFAGATYMFMIQNSRRDLTDLLMHLGPLNCSDIRDKVFGCLGLYQSRVRNVRNGLSDALRPDYTKNPTDVLRDATRFCFDDCKSLFLLARYHFEQDRRLKGLRTWIPNWYRNSSFSEPSTYPPQLFNACGDLRQPEFLHHPNPDILSLRGILFASVSRYTPTTTIDMFEDVQALAGQVERIRNLFYSVQRNESDLAMTLIADVFRDGGKIDPDIVLRAWQAFQAYIERRTKLPPSSEIYSSDVSQEDRAAAEFQYSMRRCMIGRRFFTTTTGLVGAGPKALTARDLLAIFPGSDVPFALRKKGDNYTMIGQVHVHGVMHGEVLNKDFKPSPQWMTFNIE